jgi:hypothetical protein
VAWIKYPRALADDKTVSHAAFRLYGFIEQMTHHKGYCWATNDQLGEIMGMVGKNMNRLLSELSDYIEIENSRGRNRRINLLKIEDVTQSDNETNLHKNEVVTSTKMRRHPPQKRGSNKKSNNKSNKNNKTTNVVLKKKEPQKIDEKVVVKKSQVPRQQVIDVLDIFVKTLGVSLPSNPSHYRLTKLLIEKYGYDSVVAMVHYSLSIRFNQYAPQITTPTDLYYKLSKLLLYKQKQDVINEEIPR